MTDKQDDKITMGRRASETLIAGINAKNMAIITMAQVQALIEVKQEIHNVGLELVKVVSALHAHRETIKNGSNTSVAQRALNERVADAQRSVGK